MKNKRRVRKTNSTNGLKSKSQKSGNVPANRFGRWQYIDQFRKDVVFLVDNGRLYLAKDAQQNLWLWDLGDGKAIKQSITPATYDNALVFLMSLGEEITPHTPENFLHLHGIRRAAHEAKDHSLILYSPAGDGIAAIEISPRQFEAMDRAARANDWPLDSILTVGLRAMIAGGLETPAETAPLVAGQIDPHVCLDSAVKASGALSQLITDSMNWQRTGEGGTTRHSEFYEGLDYLQYDVSELLASAAKRAEENGKRRNRR